MAITTAERTQIIELTVLMFNAAPGATYLSQIVALYEANPGTSAQKLQALANQLATTSAFTSLHPNFETAEEFAAEFLTPLGLQNDAVARDFVIAKFNAGVSKGQIMYEGYAALQAIPADANNQYSTAVAILENMTEVAEYYSVTKSGVATDLTTLQSIVSGVTSDDATVTAAKASIDGAAAGGQTFTLSAGADNVIGTAGDDVINAMPVSSTGAEASTFTSFDSINGAGGTDTLNIYSTGTTAGTDENVGFPTSASVTGVEIVNIFNMDAADPAAFGDASKFDGVTQLWQHNAAVAVTKLASSTVAGFKDVNANVSVTAADAATSGSVALNNYGEGNTVSVAATGTGALNAVNVTGSVDDSDDDGSVATTTLAVTVGADVETLTVNTAVETTLTVADGAGTKKVSTVNAGASGGAITYAGATTVANITTGSGADTVSLQTAYSATVKSASVASGAGKDTVNVLVDNTADISGTAVTVSAGDGDDTIKIDTTSGAANAVAVSVDAGAGNDKVTLTDGIDSVATTDVINGGDGTDTVVLAGKALDAEDYIILRDVITNFEAVQFTTTGATVDASRMSAYKTMTFGGAAGTVTKVAADQSLITTVNLTATASGYVLDDPITAGDQTTYAGTLGITAKASATVTANAETVNLTVTPVTNKDGLVDTTTVTLTGDAKAANVTLNSVTDNKGTTTITSDDVLDTSALTFDNTAANAKLATLTISGNGSASVTNAAGKSLTTIDASALNSVDISGDAVTGLVYTSSNASAETIKLGGGLDAVTLNASTVLKMDTITGFTLVDGAADGKQVDAALSDDLTITGHTAFEKVTATGATLDLALVNLAASAKNEVVFTYGGDTYVYADANADDIVNDTDILVKLTGTVDVDLLVLALNA